MWDIQISLVNFIWFGHKDANGFIFGRNGKTMRNFANSKMRHAPHNRFKSFLITDKNISDDSCKLVTHFPDFPLWENSKRLLLRKIESKKNLVKTVSIQN